MAPVSTSKKHLTWRKKKQLIKNNKWKRTEKFLNKQNLQVIEKSEDCVDICKNNGRSFEFLKTAPTLSIAIPGSILDNAQSDQLRSYLAGQIARAACIYNISELIVFDDTCDYKHSYNVEESSTSWSWESCKQLAKILEYLDCPQYLRKFLFPMCDELKYAGLLNPLDAPHHLRQTDENIYREGIVTGKVSKSGTKSYAEIGLSEQVKIDRLLPENTRVTLHLHRSKKKNKLVGRQVSRLAPTNEEGVYWGYTVRLAKRLSDVFTESPYDDDYDLTIGTSDKGEPYHQLSLPELSSFKHGLIVFGGVKGLEFALSNDEKLSSVENVSHLFEAYVNTCPSQGARTIRTEEAVLISLALLTAKLNFM